MLKIFSTQLTGVFNQIKDDNEGAFEEAGRFLAQAIIGEGKILLHGQGEMSGIFQAIVSSTDSLPKTSILFKQSEELEIAPVDCVILASRYSNDKETVSLAKKLNATGACLIGMSAKVVSDAEESLEDVVSVHIDLKLTDPIVPTEDFTTKVGFPSTITALYGYYGLYFVTKEFLEEYEWE